MMSYQEHSAVAPLPKRPNRGTDFRASLAFIESFDASPSFNECADRLVTCVEEHFPALVSERNPLLAQMPSWEAEDLAFILNEYGAWAHETLHILIAARIHIDWPGVRKELDDNMHDELGKESQGIPHLELMRRGFLEQLGVDIRGWQPSALTSNFMARMRALICGGDNVFSCGALFAFEAQATEEFTIVLRVMERRQELLGRDVAVGSPLQRFIAGHVVVAGDAPHPEDLHHDRMRACIAPYVDDAHTARFIEGYLAVAWEMNLWWERLVDETFNDRVKRRLKTESNGAWVRY